MKENRLLLFSGITALALVVAVLVFGQFNSSSAQDLSETVIAIEASETDVLNVAAEEVVTPAETVSADDAPLPVRRAEEPVRDVGTVAAVTATAPTQSAATTNANDDVLTRLRATYESLDALRARFVQRVGNQQFEGTVTLNGDRYRVEMADQILVSDGTTAWAYSEGDNQVLINHYIAEDHAFSPGTFFARYPEQFGVTEAEPQMLRGTRHDVLRLVPRDGSLQLREVTLYVRSSDSMPTRVRLVDTNGQALEFELTDIERNPRLAADTFRFTPPAGTEVIDLR